MTTRELLRAVAEDYEEYATWDVLSDAARKESADLAAALRAIADRFDAEMEMAWKRSQRSVLVRLDAPVTKDG